MFRLAPAGRRPSHRDRGRVLGAFGDGALRGAWQLVSGTFVLNGAFGIGNVPGANRVGQPGQLTPVSAVISDSDLAGLNGAIHGVFHGAIGTGGPTNHYARTFNFAASPVVAAPGTVRFAFTFSGIISARGSADGILAARTIACSATLRSTAPAPAR